MKQNIIILSAIILLSVTLGTAHASSVTNTLSVSDYSEAVAVNYDTNTIYVLNSHYSGNSISVIDGDTDTLEQTFDIGSTFNSAEGIAVNYITNTIYVITENAELLVINGADYTDIVTIDVLDQPRAIAVNSETNLIYIVHSIFFDATVSVINGADIYATPAEINVGLVARDISLNPNTNLIYVTGDGGAVPSVSVIDGDTNTVTTTIPLGVVPNAIAVNPNTNLIYVPNPTDEYVFVINGADNSVDTIAVDAEPRGIAVNTETNFIYVTNTDDDTVSIINGTDYTDIETIDVGSEPIDISLNSETGTIYVVNVGDGATVSVIDGSTSSTTSEKSHGGSGDNKHKTKPTFGLSHDSFKQIVDDGFAFNGETFDITDNFWTPFDVQTVNIGSNNTFSATVFAEKNLHIQEFLFGIPQVGDAHKAELGVEIFYDYYGNIELVNVVQETEIIDIDTILVTHEKSKCKADDNTERCDTTHLSMIFLEPLQHDVMAIKAIDYKGRQQFTYLNDGFDISGVSLNPMTVKTIPGPEKYEGAISVTQTAKYSDIWVDKDGREFETRDTEAFQLINKLLERHTDSGIAKNRMHSEFDTLKQAELQKAIDILKQLCEECSDESYDKINDIFAYQFPEYEYRTQDAFLELIISEDQKAQKLLEQLYTSWYPGKVFK